MSEHTPGPWLVGGSTEFVNQVRIEPCIGVLYGKGDELEANACLVSAAPELLEFAKMFLGWREYSSHGEFPFARLEKSARAALVKATGGQT